MKSDEFKYAAGLMSGTSLDGIDAALIKIKDYGEDTKIQLVDFINHEIPPSIKDEIKECCDIEKSNVEKICSLNFKLGYLFAGAVKEVCEKADFDISKLDFIGSHGQTIYHIPKADNKSVKSTLQIGEPAVIAYETNTVTVSNFRTMDMAAGGMGAPLVPYTEYILYRSKKSRALQNIGGIGNVTVLPENCKADDIYAFDTGPGNMIIDELAKRLKGLSYDKNGFIASQGCVNENMLEYLMSSSYFEMSPPKTTGREMFGSQFVDKLLEKWGSLNAEDIIATATMFTARSISDSYRKFIFNKHRIDEVILSGGGSYNLTLKNMISSQLRECRILTQEDLGFSSDAKEAVAFAILANETLNHRYSNIIGATGAKKRVILGNITPPPINKYENIF